MNEEVKSVEKTENKRAENEGYGHGKTEKAERSYYFYFNDTGYFKCDRTLCERFECSYTDTGNAGADVLVDNDNPDRYVDTYLSI